MNKKYIILIFIVIVLLLLVFALKKSNNIDKTDKKEKKQEIITRTIEYDDVTNAYYVKDIETEKIIDASRNKEDLEIYLINPKLESPLRI